ncbi:MAG: LuxR C-terminal-related transcriptional regulator [Jatrophihabitantaceae bacterium]
MLRLPSERILLATEAARALLAPAGIPVVGRALWEFTDEPAGEAAELLVKGRLSGFALHRVRTSEPADDLEIWFHAIAARGGDQPVLAMLSQADQAVRWATEPTVEPPPTVVGWADRVFVLQQVSEEAGEVLGQPASALIGQSLIGLVSSDSLATLLFGLAHLVGSGESVSLPVGLIGPNRSNGRRQLVLMPLRPPPSIAFAIQPALEFNGNGHRSADELRLLLRRFGHGLTGARTAGDLFAGFASRTPPGLPELTDRELQIVTRLLAGDRVPAISRQLYLAQSTVRNHLSTVFAKLGVRSQQELIVLLRQTKPRPD